MGVSGDSSCALEKRPELRCSCCGAEVPSCSFCRTGFTPGAHVRCRGDEGHLHDACMARWLWRKRERSGLTSRLAKA